MDEMHGMVIAYEMRKKKKYKIEVGFKASKNTRKNKQLSKCSSNYRRSNISHEEITRFVRKQKKGIRKYKGKIPLKCFNCGEIGHFNLKCPYTRFLDSDEEEEALKKENKNTKETRNIVKEKSSRKVFSQNKTTLHLTRKEKVVVTQKGLYSWK